MKNLFLSVRALSLSLFVAAGTVASALPVVNFSGETSYEVSQRTPTLNIPFTITAGPDDEISQYWYYTPFEITDLTAQREKDYKAITLVLTDRSTGTFSVPVSVFYTGSTHDKTFQVRLKLKADDEYTLGETTMVTVTILGEPLTINPVTITTKKAARGKVTIRGAVRQVPEVDIVNVKVALKGKNLKVSGKKSWSAATTIKKKGAYPVTATVLLKGGKSFTTKATVRVK